MVGGAAVDSQEKHSPNEGTNSDQLGDTEVVDRQKWAWHVQPISFMKT